MADKAKPNALLYVLAIPLPPLALFLAYGCRSEVFINLLLTLVLWVPGIVHAWYLLSHPPSDDDDVALAETGAVPAQNEAAEGPTVMAQGATAHGNL